MDHMSPGDEIRIGPVFFFHHGRKRPAGGGVMTGERRKRREMMMFPKALWDRRHFPPCPRPPARPPDRAALSPINL
jgi:hypothetical protein